MRVIGFSPLRVAWTLLAVSGWTVLKQCSTPCWASGLLSEWGTLLTLSAAALALSVRHRYPVGKLLGTSVFMFVLNTIMVH
jgi:hypothetical protein